MKISVRFCFRGLWFGFFIHRHTRALHLCLIPFTQIVIERRSRRGVTQ